MSVADLRSLHYIITQLISHWGFSVTDYIEYYVHLCYLHRKKRLACNNVVDNKSEQYFAAHIVPDFNNIVQ